MHHFPPKRIGGAELRAARIARWFHELGHSVRVVCVEEIDRGAPGELHVQDDTYEGIAVQRLCFNLAEMPDQLRAAFDNPLLAAHFESLLDTNRPDIVHVISGYLMGLAPLVAARVRNIPRVVTLTDFWFLCPTLQLLRGDGTLCHGPEAIECVRCVNDSRRAFRLAERITPRGVQEFWHFAQTHAQMGKLFSLPAQLDVLQSRPTLLVQELNQADTVFSPTRFLAEMHIANGLDVSRVQVQSGYLDCAEFDPPQANQTSDEFRFGYFGQLTPVKGVEVLLRAFHKVARANPKRRVRLTLYGGFNASDKYRKHLQTLARGIPEIVFAGRYDHRQTLALMRQLDAIVVPSQWYENTPRVIFEAFAAQTVVIATNVGGIAEVVHDGENGLLFERGDVAALARQMNRLIEEPELAAEIRSRVVRVRPVDEAMNEIMRVYTRLSATAHNTRTA